MTDIGFSIADVLAAAQPLVTLLGPILAFAIGIPVAFNIMKRAKGLFSSGR